MITFYYIFDTYDACIIFATFVTCSIRKFLIDVLQHPSWIFWSTQALWQEQVPWKDQKEFCLWSWSPVSYLSCIHNPYQSQKLTVNLFSHIMIFCHHSLDVTPSLLNIASSVKLSCMLSKLHYLLLLQFIGVEDHACYCWVFYVLPHLSCKWSPENVSKGLSK